MYSIGVDIGGMSVKVGIVNKGEIVYQTRFTTPKTFEDTINQLTATVNDILLKFGVTVENINGIGIGSPGSVNGYDGVVEFSGNLNWTKAPVVSELKKRFNTKIKLSNDANVATLAEVKYGIAKNYKNVAMFTLGTGVGGGIVIDGKLYEGNKTMAAEVGHVLLVMDGEQCTCGRKGCIEAYISATALIRQTKNAMLNDKSSLMWKYAEDDIEKVNGLTAFECSKQGDKSAITVVDTYIKYLGESLMDMFNILRPEAFIIGGGISGQGKYLTDKLDEYCRERYYGFRGTPKVEILCAKLGNDAGIIGASALVE